MLFRSDTFDNLNKNKLVSKLINKVGGILLDSLGITNDTIKSLILDNLGQLQKTPIGVYCNENDDCPLFPQIRTIPSVQVGRCPPGSIPILCNGILCCYDQCGNNVGSVIISPADQQHNYTTKLLNDTITENTIKYLKNTIINKAKDAIFSRAKSLIQNINIKKILKK